MARVYEKRITRLSEQVAPILPEDTLAAAGRKILRREFIKMISQEAGASTGADIEHVHDMRVAIRRMRSAFTLLRPYFQPLAGNPFRRMLRKIARTLGVVRDLDVLIADIEHYGSTLDEAGKAALQPVLEQLDARRVLAREALNALFDSKAYRDFVKSFEVYLSREDRFAPAQDVWELEPTEVRHLLPMLVYDQLARVRAYDPLLESAIAEMHLDVFHAMRIAFKRLRYTISFFEDVLGGQASKFIEDVKQVQDYLGRMNDLRVAELHLEALYTEGLLSGEQAALLEAYVQQMAQELETLVQGFPTVWSHFTSKTVQRKLSAAVIV